MQFTPKGPHIPFELLQAHEEGKVVFFCGAGISYPAGLPLFHDLVEGIYSHLRTKKSEYESNLYESKNGKFTSKQYDTVLHLLEQRYANGRKCLREATYKILACKTPNTSELVNHIALLKLAKNKSGKIKIVTTNYDKFFLHASNVINENPKSYVAPTLPVPDKNWNGIAYIHGLLPNEYSTDSYELENLILTSGDFGRAYLLNAWATRFLAKLFTDYIVCFVGYSINDPILRYMTDALLAEREQGENFLPNYAFVSHSKQDEKDKVITEWKNKGINCPIPYLDEDKHSLLSKTLENWANSYSAGIIGKKTILSENMKLLPTTTVEDNIKKQVVFTLLSGDKNISNHLATLENLNIEWINVFLEPLITAKNNMLLFTSSSHLKAYTKDLGCKTYNVFEFIELNLKIFDIHEKYKEEKEIWINLQKAIFTLIYKNLANHELFHILSSAKYRFSKSFFSDLESALYAHYTIFSEEAEKMKKENSEKVKYLISKNLLNCWLSLINNNYQEHQLNFIYSNLSSNIRHLPQQLNQKILSLLTPRVVYKKPYKYDEARKEQISVELEFTSRHLKEFFKNNSYVWEECPNLLQLIEKNFIEKLLLLQEINEEPDTVLPFQFSLRSISPHEQNTGHYSLGAMVELLRDGWHGYRKINPIEAKNIAINWFNYPYKIFKRLALYTANFTDKSLRDGNITSSVWVKWLLDEKSNILWDSTYIREVLQLISSQAKYMDKTSLIKLEKAILRGPNKQEYHAEYTEEKWNNYKEYKQKLYLSKLAKSNPKLTTASILFLKKYSYKEIKKIQDSEQNEFAIWVSTHWGGDVLEKSDLQSLPKNTQEIIAWIKNYETVIKPTNSKSEDLLKAVCKEYFRETINAVYELHKENIYSADVLKEIMYISSQKGHTSNDETITNLNDFPHTPLIKILYSMPYEVIDATAWYYATYIKALSNNKNFRNIVLKLYARLFTLYSFKNLLVDDIENDNIDFPTRAINSPIGIATEGLINVWYTYDLHDNTKIEKNILLNLNQIIESNSPNILDAKIILATNLYALFRVDNQWTSEKFLPLFDTSSSRSNSYALWQGYLIQPKFTLDMLAKMKDSFLSLANNLNELGPYSESYIQVLTYIVFRKESSTISYAEYPIEFFMNPSSLEILLQTVIDIVEFSDKKEELFEQYFLPFWEKSFHKDKKIISKTLSYYLARIAIEFKEKFIHAYTLFAEWIESIDDVSYVLVTLHKNKIDEIYPTETLDLLSQLISTTTPKYELHKLSEVVRTLEQNNRVKCDKKLVTLKSLSETLN